MDQRLPMLLMLLTVIPTAGVSFVLAADYPRRWDSLARDGVHDPRNPGLRLLQEPREALSRLAPDTAGNQVRWVEALELGQVQPRSTVFSRSEPQLLDQDIVLPRTGDQPAVKFPHRAHTLWLDCSNCHDALFKAQVGGNKLSMLAMLQGEQCGLCHGAVAFPLTECRRCHSVRQAQLPVPPK